MSDLVPHKKSLARKSPLRELRDTPKGLIYKPNDRTMVEFPDGRTSLGTCLGCHDTPCMEFDTSRMDLGGDMSVFPGDPVRDICPTNAIDWDDTAGSIKIAEEDCIGCGLCALNCPYGAISLTSRGHAAVETADPGQITKNPSRQKAKHAVLASKGSLGNNESNFLNDLPCLVLALTNSQRSRLVRNFLLSCGVITQVRRKGDTNVRMDGLLRFSNGKIGVLELETSKAVLESPRALLEDIAVLNSRFDIPINKIIPLSIIVTLPNFRGEYYQVIDDIKKVLGIQCHTFTLGALCILAWHFKTIDNLGKNQFITNASGTNLFPSLKASIKDLSINEPYYGAYAPPK